jgi:hypothetical protein
MNGLCGNIEHLVGKETLMSRFIDRSGLKYGRLLAVRRSGTDACKKVVWECLCDCGNIAYVNSTALATKNTQSCGCLLQETITKHGGWKKRSYNTWRGMVRRCTNEKDKDYPNYGGLGVTVDPQWLKYENFAADMGEPPDDHTLDRIDPYGNYSLDNCRWATPTTQARNIRDTHGPRGVRLRGKKWYAEITVARKKVYSKGCDTREQALAAREELKNKHWGV